MSDEVSAGEFQKLKARVETQEQMLGKLILLATELYGLAPRSGRQDNAEADNGISRTLGQLIELYRTSDNG